MIDELLRRDFSPFIAVTVHNIIDSWWTRGVIAILSVIIFCCDIFPRWFLVIVSIILAAMVWSFWTARKTSYQPAKRNYSVSTNYNSQTNLLERYSSLSSNQVQNHAGTPLIFENHNRHYQDDNELDTSSTSSSIKDHHSLRFKEPLDAVTLSAVTSPGFTTRLARRTLTTLNPLRDCNVANLSISPSSRFKNSPTHHLKLGQLPGASWKPQSTLSPPTFLSPVNTTKFSFTRRKKNGDSPWTTYVHFAPVDVVKKATLPKTLDRSTTTPGAPAIDNRSIFGLGGLHQSPPMGMATNNSRMQKLWSPPIVLDTSSSNLPISTGGVQSCSIGDTMYSRKRNRLPDVMLDSRTSSARKGPSPNFTQDEHLKQNSKRTKYIQSPNDSLRFGTPSNHNLPFMALPNMQAHDELMTSESILEQMNQTEKRFLPDDDTISPSKNVKKSKVSVGSSKGTGGSSSGRTASPYRKRRVPEQLMTSMNEEEDTEKNRGFCSCSECYSDAAGLEHNRSSNPLTSTPDGSSPGASKKKKKNVTFDEHSFSLSKDDSHSDDNMNDKYQNGYKNKASSPFAQNIHVITKADYDIDKQRRLDRLNRILNESYRSSSSTQGRSPNTDDGSVNPQVHSSVGGFSFGSGKLEATTTSNSIFGNSDFTDTSTATRSQDSSAAVRSTNFDGISSPVPVTTTILSQDTIIKDNIYTDNTFGQPPIVANSLKEVTTTNSNETSSSLFTFGAQTPAVSTPPVSTLSGAGFSFSTGQQQKDDNVTTIPFGVPASSNLLTFSGQSSSSSSATAGTFTFGVTKPETAASSIFGSVNSLNTNNLKQNQENSVNVKTPQIEGSSVGIIYSAPATTTSNIFSQGATGKNLSTAETQIVEQTPSVVANIGKEASSSGASSSSLFAFGSGHTSSSFAFGSSDAVATMPSKIFGKVEPINPPSTTGQNQSSSSVPIAVTTPSTSTFGGNISTPISVISNIFGQEATTKSVTNTDTNILGQIPTVSNTGKEVSNASGNNTSSSLFSFGQTTSTPGTQTSTATPSGFSFTFGGETSTQKPPPPTFGQVSSNTQTAAPTTFGGIQSAPVESLPKFGQPTSETTSNIFGQSNRGPLLSTSVPIFGAPSNSSISTPTFGQSNADGTPNTTTTTTATTSSASIFGQVSSTSTNSSFGTGLNGKGLFGSTNSFTQGGGVSSSTNVFGDSTTGGATGGFTLKNPGTSVSPFGQSTTAPSTSTQSTPSNIFGQPSSTKFGQSNVASTSPFGSQGNLAPSTSPFGQANLGTGNSPFGGGNSQGTNTSSTTIPTFGQSTSTPHIFGQTNSSTTSPPFGGSQQTSGGAISTAFGSSTSNANFGQTNLFGQGSSGPTTGTFGQQPSSTTAAFSFGGTSIGVQAFGQTSGPSSTFGSPGNKSLFGQSATPSTFAFGQPQSGTAAPSFNFNTASATTNTGLSSPPFGGGSSFSSPQSQTGGLTFGAPTNPEPSQPVFQFGQPTQQPQASQQGGFTFNQQQQPFGSPQQQPPMFNLGSSLSSARRRETRTRRFR